MLGSLEHRVGCEIGESEVRRPSRCRATGVETFTVPVKRRWSAKERLGDLPEALDPVGAREQHAVADHRVVEEALVGLQLHRRGERLLVLERHVRRPEAHRRPRLLVEERRGDRAGLAEVERQQVRVVDLRGKLEDSPRWLCLFNRSSTD